MDMQTVMRYKKRYGFIVVVALLAILLLGNISQTFYIVNPGETAIKLRMGKFQEENTVSGCYFKIPNIDSVIKINNRICKSRNETTALSKDLQFVSIGVALNYRVNNATKIFMTVGQEYEEVIIDPFAQESIKAVVAQYTAEELIQNRHEAKDKVCDDLRIRLLPLCIDLIEFNFVHVDFSREFLKSVEDKQIAQQRALTAKNLTAQITEQCVQQKAQADAAAYAYDIKKRSLTPELVMLNAIEKWDGKLPVYVGSGTPLLNMP